MIDPRRLLVLRVLARTDSITQAARLLHLTPPAVSQQLAAFEKELGVALIDRSSRAACLTAAGRLLARNADRIHTELIDAEQQLADLTGRVGGPVRIAAFQSVMRGLVGPAVQSLCERHPALRLGVVEQFGRQALTALRRGELDVVIHEHDHADGPPSLPGVTSVRLLFDPYTLVVPRSWRQPATIETLRGAPWVGGPLDTACDVALRRLLAGFDRDVAIVDRCVEFPSVLALVAAGRGAAIVPRLALQDADVVVCRGTALGGRVIVALYHTDSRPTVAVTAVVDALVAQSKSV